VSGEVLIGRVMRARGNRGEVLAELDSPDPEREQKLQEVLLRKGGESRLFRVEKAWRHDGRPVLKFEGIDSISEAERWAGAELVVPEAERQRPGEGEFSYEELVGCEVANAGGRIGVVCGLEEFGGPPLLRVEAADGREILIPFARAICKEIDVAAKIIRVELPEGLLDTQ
jgi:16S rRNA processing protein RimM